MSVCNESKPYIFVSYSHRDNAKVIEIINRLQSEGFNVWWDEGIDPGTEWDENIARHIQNCAYFIAFVSNNYIGSNNCKDELNYSRDLDKPQLLVYLENVDLPGGMAMRMNRIQAIYWCNYNKHNIEDAYSKLFSANGIADTRLISTSLKANITLTFLADMELGYGERFLAREDEAYGFGSVMNIEKEYLVARQLVNQFPPCNYVDFDNSKCVATSDFHAVIIGFGKLGQAVLKEIVKHGQFEGSRFYVTIIQPGYEKISGRILTNSASMFDNYNIEFVDLDIQSKAVFDIIANDKSISYIASCIEDTVWRGYEQE